MNTETLINLQSISKTYSLGNTSILALKNANFQLKSGEIVALMGPSGCGKSTLLNIIGMLLAPDPQGEIFLFGKNIQGLSEKARTDLRRKNIGFIFQSYNLIPVMSALENVAYPLQLNGVPQSEYRPKVEKVLDRLEMKEFIDKFPDDLSGGQRQRLAIARAMVHSPRIIVADEPTASLDGKNAARVIEWISQYCKENDSALLMSTHDDRVLKHCGKVVQMLDGVLEREEIVQTKKRRHYV